jgi:hypothetical protein
VFLPIEPEDGSDKQLFVSIISQLDVGKSETGNVNSYTVPPVVLLIPATIPL